MGASKGRQRAIRSRAESAEDPHAVATITDLIHKLYALDGPSVAVRALPDDELITWSELIGAVRR